jgi:hypothetical protein
MKFLSFIHPIMGLTVLFASCSIFINKKPEPSFPARNETTVPVFASQTNYVSPLMSRGSQVRKYAMENDFSTGYCFLIDMSIHSGRNRFFVYDFEKNIVIMSGLVAHGSCKETFLSEAKFSNTRGCGCSSTGKYKIGERYRGQYGKSYKLYGLENTNSNAYKRAVVLHGFSCVPDEEIYPKNVCNSLGCAMVSPAFFNRLAFIIDRSPKPIVLWIYK